MDELDDIDRQAAAITDDGIEARLQWTLAICAVFGPPPA